jgi:hypothetical protein
VTRPRAARSRRDGYVLIEALTTMALGALVLAGIAGLVAVNLRAVDRTAMSVESLETIGRAMAAVERDIVRASRVHRTVDGAPRLVFLGAPDELRLVVETADRSGLARPVLVRWKSEVTDSGRGRVTRSEAPLLPGRPLPDVFGDEQSADTGGEVVRFAYFGPAPNGSGEVLTDVWSTPTSLPSAVRLGRADPTTLQVEGSVRVPIRTDAEIGCIESTMGWCSLTPDRQPAGGAEEGGGNQPDRRLRRAGEGQGGGGAD